MSLTERDVDGGIDGALPSEVRAAASVRGPGPGRRIGARLLRWTATVAVVILVLRVFGCAERLFYHPIREPTPTPRGVRGAELVRFQSRDGTKLCAWFVPAQDPGDRVMAPTPSDAPTIFFVHGNAGNMNWHWGFVEDLPRRGFNLFMFDYRGYGESEGRATARRPLIEDTHAALDVLLAHPQVDPRRVGVFAQSLGAAVALHVIADRPEIRCAVLESPFASWRLAAATALGGNDPGFIARGLASLLIDDSDRPLDAIGRVQVPVLIIHGDRDRIVPIVHGRLLRDAAPDRVTLVEYAGGDHNSLRETHPQATQLMVDFLRDGLARSPESATP